MLRLHSRRRRKKRGGHTKPCTARETLVVVLAERAYAVLLFLGFWIGTHPALGG